MVYKYAYEVTEQGQRTQFIPADEAMIKDSILKGLKEGFADQLHAKFAEKNIDATFIDAELIDFHYYTTAYPIGYTSMQYTAKVIFQTNKKLEGSPIDPATVAILLWILKNVVVPIIIAFIIVEALKQLFMAMVTKTTTITRLDDEGNVEWTETITEPSIGGISVVGIFVVLLFIIGLIWLAGSGRKRKK